MNFQISSCNDVLFWAWIGNRCQKSISFRYICSRKMKLIKVSRKLLTEKTENILFFVVCNFSFLYVLQWLILVSFLLIEDNEEFVMVSCDFFGCTFSSCLLCVKRLFMIRFAQFACRHFLIVCQYRTYLQIISYRKVIVWWKHFC